MAQALFNKLNIIQEEISAVKDITSGIDTADTEFDAILDLQTIQAEKNDSADEAEADAYIYKIPDTAENLAAVLSEVIEESVIETVVDNISAEIQNQTETETTNREELIPADENEENTQDITINEDPTLNTELLDTLENSAVIVLQSNIQKNQHVAAVNEDTEISTLNFADTKSDVQNFQGKVFDSVKFNNNNNNNTTSTLSLNTEKRDINTTSDTSGLDDYISEKAIKDLNIESVSSESEPNQQDSGNLMQNQTPQEQAVKAMIHGDLKFDNVVKISQVQTVKPAVEITSAKIIEQITKQLEGMYNSSKVNIVLNPESLGKISLQIINSKEGLMAQFTVTTQDTMNALLKGMDGLRESLLAQGVSVDNVVVKLSESNDSENPFDWTEQEGSRGGNKQQNSKQQKENEKHFEQTMFEINNNDNV